MLLRAVYKWGEVTNSCGAVSVRTPGIVALTLSGAVDDFVFFNKTSFLICSSCGLKIV